MLLSRKRRLTHLHLSMSPLGDQSEESEAAREGRERKHTRDWRHCWSIAGGVNSSLPQQLDAVMLWWHHFLLCSTAGCQTCTSQCPWGTHEICSEPIVVRVYEAIKRGASRSKGVENDLRGCLLVLQEAIIHHHKKAWANRSPLITELSKPFM